MNNLLQREYTNEQLIKALQAADENSFAYIYQQYHQPIFKNICKLIANEHDAEDILQEVFIELWKKKGELTKQHSVAGWLFTTSYYKSLEQLKKLVKLSVNELTEAHDVLVLQNINERYIEEENYNQRLTLLTKAIELLPPQKKIAFKLCRLEGKTYEEIACYLNVSVDTAKDYVKSASKLLRRTINTNNQGVTTLGFTALIILLIIK